MCSHPPRRHLRPRFVKRSRPALPISAWIAPTPQPFLRTSKPTSVRWLDMRTKCSIGRSRRCERPAIASMKRLTLEAQLRPVQKLLLKLYKAMLGDAPGPVLIVSYNKRFFGNASVRCMNEGMRGGSEWSVGEVELFAAFVSRVNSCGY